MTTKEATKQKHYVADNAKLMTEWNWEKNDVLGFDPHAITACSGKKVWWKCAKGHEWKAEIASRKSGSNCPFCSNRKVLQGYNDLATTHPELAKEWHPILNGDLKPTNITYGSGKMVWWKCVEGHEWIARLNSRCEGNGCPYCSGQKVLQGYNDLATFHPKLINEWHPTKNGHLKPTDVTVGSGKKVWWKCEHGHEWETAVVNRSKGSGCPTCILESQTSFPEQALLFYCKKLAHAENRYLVDGQIEVDVYFPEYKLGVEYDGRKFHTAEDARQRELRKNKQLAERGIKLIRVKEYRDANLDSRVTTFYRENAYDTGALNDVIAKTLAYIGKYVLKNSINPCINVDVDRDRGQIYKQYVVNDKANSLTERYPEIAAEWDIAKNKISPNLVAARSNKRAWWRCEHGHEWEAAVCDRTKGTGCPVCSNQRVLSGFNDLATKSPNIAKEWHPTKNGKLKPTDVGAGSIKKVWWRCEHGHEWEASVADRAKGCNCPYCAGQRVFLGYNDLAFKRPDVAKYWHPTKNGDLRPTDVTVGSGRKVWWKCGCGYEWQTRVTNKVRGSGCPMCARERRKKRHAKDTPNSTIIQPAA